MNERIIIAVVITDGLYFSHKTPEITYKNEVVDTGYGAVKCGKII